MFAISVRIKCFLLREREGGELEGGESFNAQVFSCLKTPCLLLKKKKLKKQLKKIVSFKKKDTEQEDASLGKGLTVIELDPVKKSNIYSDQLFFRHSVFFFLNCLFVFFRISRKSFFVFFFFCALRNW